MDDEDDDSRGGRGTRSRGDDDRDDDSRPTASPVATAPTSLATAGAVPAQPNSGDDACDDGDDDGDDRDDDDRDDDKRKDRPSTAPSAGTPTAAATTAVVPAAPVVLTATTVGFTEFNVGGTRTLDPAVRIFGPGATVAQDLEPEYITVAGDRAFVTLQENNAIAEIDIESASVIAIRPLALKDHSLARQRPRSQ